MGLWQMWELDGESMVDLCRVWQHEDDFLKLWEERSKLEGKDSSKRGSDSDIYGKCIAMAQQISVHSDDMGFGGCA